MLIVWTVERRELLSQIVQRIGDRKAGPRGAPTRWCSRGRRLLGNPAVKSPAREPEPLRSVKGRLPQLRLTVAAHTEESNGLFQFGERT